MTIQSSHVEKSSPAPALSVITLVNDPAQYLQMRAGLSSQLEPNDIQWIPVDADDHGWNAATALNHGLDQARAEWIICAHQDILFPKGWWNQVLSQIQLWQNRSRKSLGIIGLVGLTRWGSFRGGVKDPHGHGCWKPLPARVVSVDEHLIIINRSSGFRFDPDTPGFHCYGTDIALEAHRQNFAVIAIDAPVTHLSAGTIDQNFHASARWLLQKWNRSLLSTCAAVIEDHSWRTIIPSAFVRFNRRRSILRGRIDSPVPGNNLDSLIQSMAETAVPPSRSRAA